MPVKKVQSQKEKVKNTTQKSKVEKATAKTVVKVTKPASKGVTVPVEKKVATKSVNLSIPVYSLAGRESGQVSLPKEIFGAKVNKQLLSQAVRVYMTNQKNFLAKTKTRGEIKASKAKIYRQKGTGRARHGAISAPIFVGGGIVFGPQVRNVRLSLPQRMRKAALYSALSSKLVDKNIVGLAGVEKATGKTKEISALLKKIKPKLRSALIVTDQNLDNVVRGVNNISGVDVLSVNLMNAYDVLKHEMLLITKDAVEKLNAPAQKEESKK